MKKLLILVSLTPSLIGCSSSSQKMIAIIEYDKYFTDLTYEGTILNKSGSYNNALSITGNEVITQDAVLVHPDVFTAKGETESYSSQGKPYSLACQIMNLNDFNETINILNDLDFKGGTPPENNPSQSWCEGDSIKIQIKAPKVDK